MNFDRDLKELKGIGDKTAKLLQNLELFTVRDLLYHLPREYEKLDEPVQIGMAVAGNAVSIRCRIPRQNMLLKKNGRFTFFRFFLEDSTGKVEVTYFNMPYLKSTLKEGSEYVFRGRLDERNGKRYLDHPKFYKPEEYENMKNRLLPVYPLTKGITGTFLQKKIREALTSVEFEEEFFPESILEEYDLCAQKEAFEGIHFPKNEEEAIRARRRLVFEEFLGFCLEMRLRKKEVKQLPFPRPLMAVADTVRLLEQLPFSLTKAQNEAWHQIQEDMEKNVSMGRLIQGDVGSGKTILAVLALLMCAANGRQGAFMAPTDVLARQHFDLVSQMSKDYGLPLKPLLLVGSLSAREKRLAYEEIESGAVNVVIGTHALIQEKVVYNDLALVITDEQHRFGVKQRQLLHEKGENTHILVMSATPIPRTMALILFGDLDLTVLDELPKGRIPIKNCVVDPSYRPKAYQFMEKEINKGHQIYCICPMVEEGQMDHLENVVTYSEKLKDYFGNKARIACLHGRMKASEKSRIMDDFIMHRIDILVSTTVIEVGINIPNATVMMVENAQRFGLAQLHQLRGRVGRGKEQSYCILINSNPNSETSPRLDLMNRSNDGFYLANEDMKLRGPGDIFGIRQSGSLEFKVGDIYNDSRLLMEAASLAERIAAMEDWKAYFPQLELFWAWTRARVDFRTI